VLDGNGDPVVGATVMVKGTTIGVTTGVNGDYNIAAPPDATLTFSFLGMGTKDEAVGGRTRIDVVMGESSQAIDEVVVVGYGVQKKRDLTSAISTVKMSDAPVQTISTVSHALAGKAAGLRVVQATAQPGAGASFRIRGETSINAGNEPLIVIDGMPVSSSPSPGGANGVYQSDAGSQDNVLEMLNPNDIESIEVLKDASAAAIYGARAGHGVILVTTKRGKEGKINVTYSGNASVQSIAKNYELMNAQEYMQLNNTWYAEYVTKMNGQGIYQGYVTPVANPLTYTPKFTDEQIANAQTTDWIKEISRTGFQHSHNVSLTGGNDPDFTFGFNNTLRYKNFDLNIYFYGEVNRLHGPSYYDDYTITYVQPFSNQRLFGGSKQSLNTWRADNQGNVPSILGSYAGTTSSDYILQKVSFVRCRNITLGYLIPVSKKIVNSLRVNVSVNNPFVITNYNGLDPETDYNLQNQQDENGASFSYPNVRTYSVGVDINF
jgi:TonB-dependent SusC/RagA subfamily outer membrane receptor